MSKPADRVHARTRPPSPCNEAFGFTLDGTFREVGRTFGGWVDTAWYQRFS